MTPVQAVMTGFKNTFKFSGRASVAEFWWLLLALTGVEVLLVTFFDLAGGFNFSLVSFAGMQIPLVFALTCVALAIPLLSVTWRRLHDIGWVGWLVLIWLAIVSFFFRILMMVANDLALCRAAETKKCFAEVAWGYGFSPAFIAFIFVVGFGVILARPSQSGTNNFGPNPQEAD